MQRCKRHFRIFAILLTLLISSHAHADSFALYVDVIKEECNYSNVLSIKKSLISLLRDDRKTCLDIFTQKIIAECHRKIECGEFYALVKRSKFETTGNVIGPTK